MGESEDREVECAGQRYVRARLVWLSALWAIRGAEVACELQ